MPGVLEIHRDPAPTVSAGPGRAYRSVQVLARGAAVSPLAAPGARVAVADLLPPE